MLARKKLKEEIGEQWRSEARFIYLILPWLLVRPGVVPVLAIGKNCLCTGAWVGVCDCFSGPLEIPSVQFSCDPSHWPSGVNLAAWGAIWPRLQSVIPLPRTALVFSDVYVWVTGSFEVRWGVAALFVAVFQCIKKALVMSHRFLFPLSSLPLFFVVLGFKPHG